MSKCLKTTNRGRYLKCLLHNPSWQQNIQHIITTEEHSAVKSKSSDSNVLKKTEITQETMGFTDHAMAVHTAAATQFISISLNHSFNIRYQIPIMMHKAL